METTLVDYLLAC